MIFNYKRADNLYVDQGLASSSSFFHLRYETLHLQD